MSAIINSKQLIDFIQTYLSVIRRYCTVLPLSRKYSLPDFWSSQYQILAYACEDGIAIEFRRKIGKKIDSIAVLGRKTLANLYPHLIGANPRLPIDGLEGILVTNLAISTKSCMPFLKADGTLLEIPDEVGFLGVTAGGDVQLQKVNFFYVDEKGVPRQFAFKCLWILACDAPILSSPELTEKRALGNFLRQLLSGTSILGERMRRYSEFDLLTEFKEVEREYRTLFNSENVAEQEMQYFFENHAFVLSPFYLDICPKSITIKAQMEIRAIDRKVDFVLLKEPNLNNYGIKCSAIELKKPNDKLFTNKGEPSDQLTLGLSQISAIFEFVRSKPEEARKLLGIKDLSNLAGTVLIGRRKDLKAGEAELLIETNRKNPSQKILLYDDLLENIAFTSEMLGKKARQPVVVVGQKGDSSEDFTGKSSEVIQEASDYLARRIREGF